MKLLVRAVVTAVVAGGLLTQAGQPAVADNTQTLGMSVFRDILVDQAHGRVFVSGGSVVAADLEGNVLGSVPGISAARQMSLSPDGSKLVVADGDFLTVVDPVSLMVTDSIPTGVGSCPEGVTASSGKIFFTYGDCVAAPGLGAVPVYQSRHQRADHRCGRVPG